MFERMENIDLSFFLEPPVLDTAAILTIEALAPLSMVPAQPGSYYRSQAHPTDAMIFGMLENALGWHFGGKQRSELLKDLRKTAGKHHSKQANWKESGWLTDKSSTSDSGFISLLMYHFRIDTQWIPQVMEYDDFWTQHLHDNDDFMGGSKHYDARLESLINLSKQEDKSKPKKKPSDKKHPMFIDFGPKQGEKSEDYPVNTFEEALTMKTGKIHVKALRKQFPRYYSSPKRRGYVVPKGPYQYRIDTTETLALLIERGLNDPAAPLYLGSNDGWVDVNLELI